MPFVTSKDSETLNRETEGIWVAYGEGELKIARMGNPHNRAVFAKLRAPFKNHRGGVPDREAERIVCQCYAESLLLDWRNVVDEKGEEYPYTVENAVLALTHDQSLRDFVEQVSRDESQFREEGLEDSAKKSSRKSNGKGDGAKASTPSSGPGIEQEKGPKHSTAGQT